MPKVLDTWMKRLDNWLWKAETTGDSKTSKALWHGARILFAVVRDVVNGHIILHAMSLVFTTILASIPLLALSFSVLKGLGYHNRLEPILAEWLAPLGDKAPELIDSTLAMVDGVNGGVLGTLGSGLLIYWVISLVQKVERSFNEIWRVSAVRSWAQRFSNYLSVIMTGPVLMIAAGGATAVFVGSNVVQQIISVEPFGWLFAVFSRLTPYFIIIGLFTFLYVFVPNTKVKIRNAFFGGIVAGVLWQLSIVFFTLTVANSLRFAIFAGFSTPILLLFWLYFNWVILLIGASVAFYSQHAHQITRERVNIPSATVDERTGLVMMYQVAHHFDQCEGGTSIMELESNLSVGPEVIQRMMNKLIQNKLLVISSDGNHLFPARPLDKISMRELLNVVRSPQQTLPASLINCEAVTKTTKEIEAAVDQVLQQKTISEWIRTEPPLETVKQTAIA